jgi:hypothetical protein
MEDSAFLLKEPVGLLEAVFQVCSILMVHVPWEVEVVAEWSTALAELQRYS